MFAVIYQGYVMDGHEAEYKKLWHKVACYFMERRGAIGSCLHQAGDGLWLAYSRWPDRATRDASWPGDNAPSDDELPDDIKSSIAAIKSCLDQERKLPEICMEVKDDLLLKNR